MSATSPAPASAQRPAASVQSRKAPAIPRSSALVLYAGFALTGVGCALPGVLLPLLRGAGSGLGDERTGTLFFLIAAAAALGPLLLAGRAVGGLRVGFALLALAGADWAWQPRLPLPGGALWGLGLGMTMTATSLMSQRMGRDRTVVLLRLNFLWAAGACACPLLVGLALSVVPPRWVPLAPGAAALACGLAALRLRGSPATLTDAAAVSAVRSGWSLRGVPLPLVFGTMLAPGIEACAGAWLTTYADRSTHSTFVTLATPACFWAGLLGSRALSWWPGAHAADQRLLRGLLLLVVVAAGALLLPPHPPVLLAASALLGFGLGPLYPHLLAGVLALRSSTLIFFLAGVSSSVLPWTTGAVSTSLSSLRGAFLVPFAAAVLLLLLGWRVAHPHPKESAEACDGNPC